MVMSNTPKPEQVSCRAVYELGYQVGKALAADPAITCARVEAALKLLCESPLITSEQRHFAIDGVVNATTSPEFAILGADPDLIAGVAKSYRGRE